MTEPFNVATWLVDRHVDEGRGDRVALRCEGRSTTYTELLHLIWRAQHLLADVGAESGDRVAMVVQDDEAFPAFFLGAQRSGIVPVPLSTMLKGPALGSIIADAGAVALVVSDTFAGVIADIVAAAPTLEHVIVCGGAAGAPTNVGELPGLSGRQLRWPSRGELDAELRSTADAANAAAAGAGSDDVAPITPAPVAGTTVDSRAFFLYSSGTTGTPKGIMHRHGNVRATFETYASQVLKLTEGDRCLSVAKLFFAYGLGNSLTFPLAAGATAILNPLPPSPPLMAKLLADEQPTLFFSSPGFCAALLDAGVDREVFAGVRATVTAGESLPADLQMRFAEFAGCPVLDGIGSTELLHIFISNLLTAQVPGTSGWVVPGYAAELRDDNGEKIVQFDTPGYLHVQGDSAAVGYWGQPEATRAVFRDGWVRTGDVYVRHHDKSWTFLGRNSDMIKAGGIWVSPAEVEAVLIAHESVLEAAVVGARDRKGLETVVAFVVPASGVTVDAEELVQHCRREMASFKRPRRIEIVDELPKTATGKIKRFELRDSVTWRPKN